MKLIHFFGHEILKFSCLLSAKNKTFFLPCLSLYLLGDFLFRPSKISRSLEPLRRSEAEFRRSGLSSSSLLLLSVEAPKNMVGNEVSDSLWILGLCGALPVPFSTSASFLIIMVVYIINFRY